MQGLGYGKMYLKNSPLAGNRASPETLPNTLMMILIAVPISAILSGIRI